MIIKRHDYLDTVLVGKMHDKRNLFSEGKGDVASPECSYLSHLRYAVLLLILVLVL